MVKVKPLGKRVLIKRAKAVTTKGGIYLPDTAQEKPREGEVIAIGTGKVRRQRQARPSDTKNWRARSILVLFRHRSEASRR